ncbi:MAG: hypothetical protein HOH43_25375 [Candidatus Latescibacteria bacterium]|jgi:hypothetical protein|nr:hypothetical protein [Candidatus Latescibacterota bacterium]
MIKTISCIFAILLIQLSISTNALAQDTEGNRYALIVGGIGGEEKYEDLHWTWSSGTYNVLREEHRIPDDHLYLLVSNPAVDPALPARKSTLTMVEQVFDELKQKVTASDILFVILIGHGSATGSGARLNIPGPDLSSTRLSELMDSISAGRIVVVNGSSSSGPFIDALSGQDRVIITATKSGGERIATVFPEHFLAALSVENSDLDKDGFVSLLEAFTYSRLKTEEWYEDQGRLATEHPMLDDNGDQKGSRDPGGEDIDGALARTITFGNPTASATLKRALSPEDSARVASLELQSRDLQNTIDSLKPNSESLTDEEYNARLEDLLIGLARVNREIRTLTLP